MSKALRCWGDGSRVTGHVLEAFVGVQRHDARKNRGGDALGTDRVDPALKDVIVVEELCDDHFAARVALLLEVVQLLLHVGVGTDKLLVRFANVHKPGLNEARGTKG